MVIKFGFESSALRLGTPGILVLVGDSRTPGRTISFQLHEEKVPDGHAALQGLSSIPHLTSVAAGFYESDVIIGSETSVGRARAMMHKFAVAPARLIDNVGCRAIRIALRPQHFIGDDVLGMNRCHGRRHRSIRGGHGGARLSLLSLLSRCAGRAEGVLSRSQICSQISA